MGIIKALDKRVYEKIAAGEVIDRPSAVIRELLDNAFDANAGKIKINFEGGGLSEITVADDGDGILFEDLEKAPIKHFTSKISEFEDIFSTYTMGFRGEALSSIASVSRIRITSYNGQETHGGELTAEGGVDASIKPFVRKKGTTVEVKDLFFNVPVRQKFVKSVQGESRSIKDVIISKSLPFVKTAISVTNTGKTIIDSSANSLIERIREYFSSVVDAKFLMEIEQPAEELDIKIYGYAGSPQLFSHNRSLQYLYVNNRPVLVPSFYYALSSVYEGIIPGGKFPVVFLFMDINPAHLDVNIHPAKKEIRFINEKHIFSLIKKSVASAFQYGFCVPDFIFSETINTDKEIPQAPYENYRSLSENIEAKQSDFDFKTENQKSGLNNNIFESASDAAAIALNPSFQSNYKIVGILFNTYLLVENHNDFYIVDYHAAHERMNYEKLSQSVKKTGIISQKLLTPFQIELSSEEADYLSENMDVFHSLGYEVDEFGENAYIINGVPAYKKYGDEINFFLDILHKTMSFGIKPGKESILDEILKMESCRMSIKSGDNPGAHQISNLVEELLVSGYPLTCPHGRPIIFKMSRDEINKKFLR